MDEELRGRNNRLSKTIFPKFKCNQLTKRIAIDERNELFLKLLIFQHSALTNE